MDWGGGGVGYRSDNTPENLSRVEAGKRLFEFHQDRFVSPTKGSDIDLHYLYRHYSQLAHQLIILADERHSLKQREGKENEGRVGEFRKVIHAIESLLQQQGAAGLTETMLQIRRREKNFLLRGRMEHVAAVTDLAESFRNELPRSTLATPDQQHLRTLIDQYETLFLEAVDIHN